MDVYHVTTPGAVPLIKANGLRTIYSQTRDGRPAFWVCEESRLEWAVTRTKQRKGIYEEKVVIVPVTIADGDLIKAPPLAEAEGVWACLRDIPVSQIGPMFGVWPEAVIFGNRVGGNRGGRYPIIVKAQDGTVHEWHDPRRAKK